MSTNAELIAALKLPTIQSIDPTPPLTLRRNADQATTTPQLKAVFNDDSFLVLEVVRTDDETLFENGQNPWMFNSIILMMSDYIRGQLLTNENGLALARIDHGYADAGNNWTVDSMSSNFAYWESGYHGTDAPMPFSA